MFYQVYEVDVCFSSYAIGYKLIGAKDESDLKSHIKDILGETLTERELSEIISPEDEDYPRIKEIKGLLTDKPYEVLTSYAYYE